MAQHILKILMTFNNIVNYVVQLLTGKLSQLKGNVKRLLEIKGIYFVIIYQIPWGYSTYVNTSLRYKYCWRERGEQTSVLTKTHEFLTHSCLFQSPPPHVFWNTCHEIINISEIPYFYNCF